MKTKRGGSRFTQSNYQALGFMVTIVSGSVSLPCSRNNGTKKQFPIDILNLTNQNSIDISFFHCDSQLVEEFFRRFSG